LRGLWREPLFASSQHLDRGRRSAGHTNAESVRQGADPRHQFRRFLHARRRAGVRVGVARCPPGESGALAADHRAELAWSRRRRLGLAAGREPPVRLSGHLLTKAATLPATWLSHGYQSTIAWVADVVGHIMWEAERKDIRAAEMEGIVLVDELDAHLH